MIHYHGTPCGGSKNDGIEFVKGRHVLISFAYPSDISFCSKYSSSFILDNGAFTFWKGGKKPNWDMYLEWVSEWGQSPTFDWWLIPDVIDGDENENWKLMFHYGRKFPYGVPVYHLHESFYHLERMINSYPKIAIGSSGEFATIGTPAWWNRMDKIMNVICSSDGVPKCKIHGLRMLDKKITSKFPFSSADSCNATRNGGNLKRGEYKLGNGIFEIEKPERFINSIKIAEKIESQISPQKYQFEEKGIFII